jgi:hypothetical protein
MICPRLHGNLRRGIPEGRCKWGRAASFFKTNAGQVPHIRQRIGAHFYAAVGQFAKQCTQYQNGLHSQGNCLADTNGFCPPIGKPAKLPVARNRRTQWMIEELLTWNCATTSSHDSPAATAREIG